MLGGADNPNGELPSYITGADTITASGIPLMLAYPDTQSLWRTANLWGNGTNCRPL
ncbi:hypothetical protein H6219_004981 [Escherichia coli]|nr:hypothetical protein [Escherichia coli]